MKPLKPKKSIEGVSRAKMFIKKNLDFLTGCPNPDGTWLLFTIGGEPASITITRDHLHNAAYTISKLVNDFPIALPKIVGDVEKWSSKHKNLLELLKPAVHDGKPFLKSLTDRNTEISDTEKRLLKRLLKAYPSLEYILDSFSWITFLNPEEFCKTLLWVDRNAIYIDKIYNSFESSFEGLTVVIRLWHLADIVDHEKINYLLQLLSDPRINEFTMEQGCRYVNEINNSLGRKKKNTNFNIPSIPKACFKKDLIKWVHWMSLQDSQTAKRSIELFQLIFDRSVIDNWEYWWKALNASINIVLKLPENLPRHNPITNKIQNIRKRIREHGSNTPPVIKSKLIFNLIEKWSEKENLQSYKIIYKALCVLPAEYKNTPVRMAFLAYWSNLLDDNISKQKLVVNIIEEFKNYIKNDTDFPKLIIPWNEVISKWNTDDGFRYIYTIDDDILDDISKPDYISFVFDLLRELFLIRNLDSFSHADKTNLVHLIDIVEQEKVPEILLQLKREGLSDEYIPKNILKTTANIAGQRFETFAAVTKALLNNEDKYYDITRIIDKITNHCLSNNVYESFLLDVILGNQLKAICDIALKTGLTEYFGEKELPLPKLLQNRNHWIQAYPKALHKALIRLSMNDENAEIAASRILSKNFPDHKKLAAEINELRSMIEAENDMDGFLKLRLDKLTTRLAEKPPELGEQKLLNLSKKLEHAAMLGLLQRWSKAVDEKFKSCLKSYLKMDEFPRWLEKNGVLEIILSTNELKPAFQDIAHKVFLRRASNLAWDFRDEPKNKGFIQKLEESGINMTPWLNGDDKIIKEMPNGEKITFTIERDPIEVFSMGLHFKTCLSPGGINFFSVISNIIDINKQVIYGKNEKGAVRARALIALTDTGGILTFNPYCNNSNIGFSDILKEFVHELAKKMNNMVLPSGKVSKLLAPDWYDDGPRDLTQKFSFTLDGSDFRNNLTEKNPEKLLSIIKAAAGPVGLNEITIPLFIYLPEAETCENLLNVLYPYVLKLNNLPSDALLKYGELLANAGKFGMLENLVPKIAVYAEEFYNERWGTNYWAELLIKISPGKALQLIKKTRPRYVHTWDDEEGERIADAAEACLGLNRAKQAEKLFSMALEKDIYKNTREFCVSRLEELTESMGP